MYCSTSTQYNWITTIRIKYKNKEISEFEIYNFMKYHLLKNLKNTNQKLAMPNLAYIAYTIYEKWGKT